MMCFLFMETRDEKSCSEAKLDSGRCFNAAVYKLVARGFVGHLRERKRLFFTTLLFNCENFLNENIVIINNEDSIFNLFFDSDK